MIEYNAENGIKSGVIMSQFPEDAIKADYFIVVDSKDVDNFHDGLVSGEKVQESDVTKYL